MLIVLGRKKFNINRLQVDSVYFSTEGISEEPGDGHNSRQKIHAGQMRFKGRIELPGNDSNGFENLSFEEHSFQAANLSVYFPQNLYSFHIDTISLDGPMNTISIEKIKVLPNHKKEEFYQYVEYETDRIETHLGNIEIRGLRTHKTDGRRGLMSSRAMILNQGFTKLLDMYPLKGIYKFVF